MDEFCLKVFYFFGLLNWRMTAEIHLLEAKLRRKFTSLNMLSVGKAFSGDAIDLCQTIIAKV